MSETDAEFLDGAEYAYGHHMVPQHRDRLFALARRGAAVAEAEDVQFARIQQLETVVQDLAEIALKLEKERDSLKAEKQTVGHLDNVETAVLRTALALKIDEAQFLAAVDREGDYECGAGKFTDDKRAHSAFANSENASKGEQRTICEACGNSNLAHDRAAWTDDGTSYCPSCLPPPPKGAEE